MSAIDIACQRLSVEEGFKQFLYDDATGLPVRAPVGNASIGYGENVAAGWSRELALVVMNYRLQMLFTDLLPYAWFASCNDIRQSVLLDIGYSAGLSGLLHFPEMVAAIGRQDWTRAQAECQVKNPQLKGRYDTLGLLLLTGAE